MVISISRAAPQYGMVVAVIGRHDMLAVLVRNPLPAAEDPAGNVEQEIITTSIDPVNEGLEEDIREQGRSPAWSTYSGVRRVPGLELLVAATDADEALYRARPRRAKQPARRGVPAARYNLPARPGSDGHSRPEYAHAYIEIELFANRDEFVANLKNATIMAILRSPFFVHFFSASPNVAKKLARWRRAPRAHGKWAA
ncbi:MAG: hypothetical protein U0841_23850 [Chloroflexia bacterium]